MEDKPVPAERRGRRRDRRAIRPFTQREVLRLFHRDRMVRVTGLPQSVTELQVLSLFAELSVKSIRLEPCGKDGVSALVDPVEPELLESWWQRGQFYVVKGLRAKAALTPTENLLCVAGLPPSMSHARFYKLVRRFGPVSTWFLMTDPQTSLSKGYGFVRHVSFPAALSARTALSAEAMGEYDLFCDWLEGAETLEDLNSKCLFLDHIPYLSSASQLEELLSVVVKPRYCRIYEKFGLLQDWAIVAFLKPDVAEKTRQLCDGALLCGQRIRVVHCIPGNRSPHDIFSEFATRWDKVNGSPNLQPTPPLSEALSYINNSTSVPPEDTEEICSVMQDAYQSIPPRGGFSGHHRDMHHILRFIVTRVRLWPSQKQIPCDVLNKIIDFECKECSRYFEFIEAESNSCSRASLMTGSGGEDDAEKVQSDFDSLHKNNTNPPLSEVAPTPRRPINRGSSLYRNTYFQSPTNAQEVRSSAVDEVLSSDASTLFDVSDSSLERDFSPDSLLYSSRGQSTSLRENCSPQSLLPKFTFPNDGVDSILQATSEMCLQNRSSTPKIGDSSRNMLTDGFNSLTQVTSALANNVASYTWRGRTDNLTQPSSAMGLQNLAQSTSAYVDLHENAAYTQPVLGVQSTTPYYAPNLNWRVPSYGAQHQQTVETICQRNSSVSSQIALAHQNTYGSRRRRQRQPQGSTLIRPTPATQNFLSGFTGGTVSRPAEEEGWTMGNEFVPESDSDTNSPPYGSPRSGRRTLLPLPNLNVNWPDPGQDYASNVPHYAWPVQEINPVTEDNVTTW